MRLWISASKWDTNCPNCRFRKDNRSREASDAGLRTGGVVRPSDVELRMCPCGVKFHYTPGVFLLYPGISPQVLPPTRSPEPPPPVTPGFFRYMGRTVACKNFSGNFRLKKVTPPLKKKEKSISEFPLSEVGIAKKFFPKKSPVKKSGIPDGNCLSKVGIVKKFFQEIFRPKKQSPKL